MNEVLEELKTKYVNQKKVLIQQKKFFKKENKEILNNLKHEKHNKILLQRQNIKSNLITKNELKRNMFKIENWWHDQKSICDEKGKEINKNLRNNKNDFLFKVNEIWKKEHLLKVSSKLKENINENKSVISIKNNALKCEKKVKDKIDFNNKKIDDLRKTQYNIEEEFIKIYNELTDTDAQTYESIIHWQKINKILKEVRKYKEKNRNLFDKIDELSDKYNAKEKSKLLIIENKNRLILNADKPFTKYWWSNTALEKVNTFAGKIDQQKHLNSIKNGLFAILPAVLVAAIWLLLTSVILNTGEGGLLKLFGVKNNKTLEAINKVGGLVNSITLGMMGLILCCSISIALGRKYKLDTTSSFLVGLTSFFALMPTVSADIDNSGNLISIIKWSDLGANSMFLSIITSILGIELYRLIFKSKWLKIKMPQSVPTAVSKSFNIIIPLFITTFVFALFSYCMINFAHKNLMQVIQTVIEKPLSAGFESAYGLVIYRLITDLSWSIGIHGQNIVAPIVEPISLQHITENTQLVEAGLAPKWIVTKIFLDSYTLMQYSFVLFVSMFLFTKRKDYISIFFVGIIPSLFNISEPAWFGFPVILNPILALPLIVGGIFSTLIGYFAMKWGLADIPYINVPWTTPPIIGPFLATGGDFKTIILAVTMFVVGVSVYCPFILIANKQAKIYNPELIIKRFSFKNKKMFYKNEGQNFINNLKEKQRME